MKKHILFSIAFLSLLFASCSSTKTTKTASKTPFVWENANVYFLLIDRFNNGDKTNDINYNRNKPTAILRGFEGGDIRGVIQKLDEGYFEKLGITAIWMTPVVEQIHDGVDEGTGILMAFMGIGQEIGRHWIRILEPKKIWPNWFKKHTPKASEFCWMRLSIIQDLLRRRSCLSK